MAGVWVIIAAHDPTEIMRKYPELNVVPRREGDQIPSVDEGGL
jgi:hypothetical protein